MPNPYFTWSMAEELAVGHMRSIGFRDAKRTKAGADGGIDVTSNKAVAQVKHHAAPIGIAEMQRMRGIVHDGRQAVFYSSSGYSASAKQYAAVAGIALFTFTDANQVLAANDVAGGLSASRPPERQDPTLPRIDDAKAEDDARRAAIREFLLTVWQHIYMLKPLEARVEELRDTRWHTEAARSAHPGDFMHFRYFAKHAYPQLKERTSRLMREASAAEDAVAVKRVHEKLFAECELFYTKALRVGIQVGLYLPAADRLYWEHSEWKLKEQ
jgi:hypothetical protein